MLEAATTLDRTTEGDTYQHLLPVAPTLEREPLAAAIAARSGGAKPVLVDDARAALYHARGSVVASGTATVEAALLGNPFVVVYRLSTLSYAIARRFVSVPHVAMANLIAGRRVVPELIQSEFTAANVVRALKPLLADGPAREEAIAGLREVRERLEARDAAGKVAGGTAIARAAHICVELLAGGNAAAPLKTEVVNTGLANTRGEPKGSVLPAGTYQA
jgi:lipid-A-disaccharide synthase